MNSTKYQLVKNVLFQKVADETVILEPETGQYYTLDSVGTYMVECMIEGSTQSQVITAVLAKYDATEAEITHDLKELIDELTAQNLFQVIPNS